MTQGRILSIHEYQTDGALPRPKGGLESCFAACNRLTGTWAGAHELPVGWHHHVTLTMAAYGFLMLEHLRTSHNFWVDLPEPASCPPSPAGHVDRGVPHVRPAS